MHFKDKVVWITGASSGIGKELVIQLSKQNAILILTSTNLTLLNELQASLTTKSYVLPFDLLNIDGIENLVQQAMQLEGKIDYVIQSAGISQRSLANETNLDVYKKLMAINYFAPLALTQAILPYFKKIDSGSITVISSIAGLIGFPLRSGYCASKHAIKGYLETLQSELYKTNIHISIVYPGRINTPISKNALLGNGLQFGSSDENNEVGMEVSVCAEKILSGIEKRKKNIIIVKAERILFWLWWFVPSLYYKIANSKGVK
ncbi:SDR family oxidoreductase [Flavobacterium sp.]|uniref:SDR family oxidoreductase n=1 Tax=Flavobacterium sp. TaxID=239 RepID=UPI002639CB2C|nr:SDR family oxidoreductase [Flavobacterium sp.]